VIVLNTVCRKMMNETTFQLGGKRLLAHILVGVALFTAGVTALADGQPIKTPPPVSGRSLEDADSILPADVLARVELLRADIELLRQYMGREESPRALLRVVKARPAEVYSQALNLESRASRLAFEQVRAVNNQSMPPMLSPRPADVFAAVDAALAAVLLVKQDMNIRTAVAEMVQPESTTPSDVFNAAVAAGAEINGLLDSMTSASDVFQLVTSATHIAAALHTSVAGTGNLPDEPAFESGKMPADVLIRMRHCFDLVTQLAKVHGIAVLEFQMSAQQSVRGRVTPNDVSDMAALLVAELNDVHRSFRDARPAATAYYPGKLFPAHVYQRAGLLELILQDLVRASAAAVPGDSGK
jgi:hypothetical protein